MLDLIFWSVVCLVVWLGWVMHKDRKAQRDLENATNEKMETINGFKGQGPLGL